MLVSSNKRRTYNMKCSLRILILSIMIHKIQNYCWDGENGCQLCADIYSCEICQPGIYPVPSGGCQACPAGSGANRAIYNCSPCQAGSGCLECFDDYKQCTKCSQQYGVVIATNTCKSCPSNCLTCQNSAQKCTQCLLGYGFKFGGCQPCSVPYCLQCPQNSDTCSKCKTTPLQYFLRQNLCVPCKIDKCIQCTTDLNQCQKCMRLFGMNASSGKCTECQAPNCQVCGKNYSICNYCKDSRGLGLDHQTWTCQTCSVQRCCDCLPNRAKCRICQQGWGWDQINGICQPCRPTNPNCQRCDYNVSKCFQCEDGFGLTSDHKCQKCTDPLCRQCYANSSVCTFCAANFGVNSTYQCQPCIQYCQLCSTGFRTCSLCINDRFHGLDPRNTCPLCLAPCHTCRPTGYSQCTSCLDGYFLDNYNYIDICAHCDYTCTKCTSLTNCTKCIDGYYLQRSGSQFICEPCPPYCSRCQYEPLYGLPTCTQCDSTPKIELIDRRPARCLELCGDSYTLVHQCDNQKGIVFDGCNDTCQPMEDFTCRNSTTVSGKTECSYNVQIIMTVVEFEKSKLQNKFEIKLEIYPPLYMFRRLTKQQFMSTFNIQNSNVGVTNVEYDSIKNILTIEASISQTIQQNLKIYFNHLQNVDAEFFKTPTVQILYHPSSASDFLIWYPKSEFMLHNLILYLCYATATLAWIGCILGLIFRKLGGIQAMFVVQFGWLSVFWTNSFLYLTFEATKPLKYTNLYHYPIYEETDQLKSLNHPYLQQFALSKSYFANNFNIELVLAFFILIAVVVTETRLRKFKKSVNFSFKLEKQVAQKIMKLQNENQFTFQCLLSFVLINIQYYISCTVLLFKYGQITHLDSLLVFSFWTAFVICTFFLFFIIPYAFGYFRLSFIYKNRFTVSHYFIYIFILIASTTLLTFLSSISFVAGPPYLIFLIYTLIQKPYKAKIENYRSCFNLFVSSNWIGFKVFCQYSPTSTTSFARSLYLLANVILTFIATILGIVSVVYFYRKEKNRTKGYDQNDPRYKHYKLLIQLEQINVTAKNEKNPVQNTYKKYLQPKMTLKSCSEAMRQAVEEGLLQLQQQRKHFFNQQMRHPLSRQNNYPQAPKKQIKKLKPQDLSEHMINKKKIRKSIFYIDQSKMTQNILCEQQFGKQKREVYLQEQEEQEQNSQKLVLKIIVQQNGYINYRGAETFVKQQKRKPKNPNHETFIEAYDDIKSGFENNDSL